MSHHVNSPNRNLFFNKIFFHSEATENNLRPVLYTQLWIAEGKVKKNK